VEGEVVAVEMEDRTQVTVVAMVVTVITPVILKRIYSVVVVVVALEVIVVQEDMEGTSSTVVMLMQQMDKVGEEVVADMEIAAAPAVVGELIYLDKDVVDVRAPPIPVVGAVAVGLAELRVEIALDLLIASFLVMHVVGEVPQVLVQVYHRASTLTYVTCHNHVHQYLVAEMQAGIGVSIKPMQVAEEEDLVEEEGQQNTILLIVVEHSGVVVVEG
jgi:hypothetical protein